MIKAIIIEDEKKSQELLKDLIEKNVPEIEVLGCASGVSDGISLVNKVNPELVFLDISMGDGTGFDLLHRVEDKKFDVIFTTATDKYAMKAIKYSALDYLLKPIDIEELKVAVKKITKKEKDSSTLDNLKFLLQNIQQKDDNFSKITLPTGNAYEIVQVADIIRCEADGNYTKFYLTNNRKFVVSLGMKHYEDLLPEKDFIRVHHHHLININHVIRYLKEDGGYAIMSDTSRVEISRRKKDTFLERLQKI